LGHESGESFNIVCGHLNDIANEWAVTFAVWGDSLCTCSAVRSAVIAALARDDQSSFGMASLDVRESRQLHRGVDRFGPRGCEEYACIFHRSDRNQFLGKLLGGFIGERIES
jgi:hypothetical protein